MEFGDLSDNPFAAHASDPARPRRRGLVSAAKFLLLVAVCLALTLVFGSLSQRWLVHRLTHDLDSLTADQKQARLIQIADLGPLAIEPLVGAMADEDLEVARTAYDLLRRQQNDWIVLGRSENEHCHATLVEALESVAVHLPDDRTGWGTHLLQQTLMTAIDRDDDQSRALLRNATHAMELLSLSDRAGPSILSDEPLDPLQPKRLTVQAQPLPVGSVHSSREWTDWPPPPNRSVGDSSNADRSKRDPANQLPSPQLERAMTEPRIVAQNDATESPTVYRSSSARLQPVQAGDPVDLRDIRDGSSRPRETAYQPSAAAEGEIRSATHLVDSPMETFDDKSVVHWLGSPHQALRERAKLELISRGYDGTELALATQIASGDTKTRMELIDAIARSDAIDPRPWLMMMLEDESRDVKLRVISVLGSMADPSVSRRLRTHLSDERDPTVAARIRRVLDLR